MKRYGKGLWIKIAVPVIALLAVFFVVGGVTQASADRNEPFLAKAGLEFGIICNYMNQTSDMETNFAVLKYQGNGHTNGNSISENRANAAGRILAGEIIGEKQFRNNPVVIEGKEAIAIVSDLLSSIKNYSSSVVDKADIETSSEVKDQNSYLVDISDIDKKTVYVDADNMAAAMNAGRIQNGGLKVKLRADQTVVFNIKEKERFEIPRYTVKIVDGSLTGEEVAQTVIWNMPNVVKLAISSDSMHATVIAPEAYVNLNVTGAGWLVCDTIVNNNGEWHMISKDVPDVTPTPKPTQTPGKTKTPDSTKTPKPTKNATETPVPTETPKPTETPDITEAPTNTPGVTENPTETPGVTQSPKPTATPKVTETPYPTATPTLPPYVPPTPIPTETPDVTEAPTATPSVTDIPTKTPRITDVPTDTPKPTEIPKVTESPKPTATPTLPPYVPVTPTPLPTETPDVTATPTSTVPAEITEAPTATPVPTDSAEITEAPTATPAASGAITETTEPTTTPNVVESPAVSPEISGNTNPTVEPTPDGTNAPLTTIDDGEVPLANAEPEDNNKKKSSTTTILDNKVPLSDAAPKTGDTTNLLLPVVGMGLSLIVIVGVMFLRRKRN